MSSSGSSSSLLSSFLLDFVSQFYLSGLKRLNQKKKKKTLLMINSMCASDTQTRMHVPGGGSTVAAQHTADTVRASRCKLGRAVEPWHVEVMDPREPWAAKGWIASDIGVIAELCLKDLRSGIILYALPHVHARSRGKRTSTRYDGLEMQLAVRIASKTAIHLFHINPIRSLPVARIWGYYCRDSILRLNNSLPHTPGNHWGVY